MQRLIDMSTSELVAMARNEVSSITDIGIHSELVKELTTRLCANTAAVTQALKERDEVRTELSSAMFTISQITGVLGTSETLTISEQVTALNKQVVNLAVELSVVETIHTECVFITDELYEKCPPEVQKVIRSLAVIQMPSAKEAIANWQARGVEKFSEKFGGGTLLSSMVKEAAADFVDKLRKGAADEQ